MSGKRSKRLRASQQMPPFAPHGVRRSVEIPIAGSRSPVEGSDVKQTTRGTCVLCGDVGKLELGHIVPRWAGKWLKDEGYVLGRYDSLGVHTRTQDIPKNYLLCRSCENYLGVAEAYLSNVVRGTQSDLSSRALTLNRESPELVRLEGIDARLVIRALAGILFKANASSHHIFRHVRLPKQVLAEVVRALKSDHFPPTRFSVIAIKIMNLTVPGANPRARIDADLRQFGAGFGFVARFGGFVFVMHVGARARFPLEGDIRSLRTDDDSMLIGIGEFTYEPGILPEDRFDLPRVSAGLVQPTDPCPCGLDLTFIECCSGRWLSKHAQYLAITSETSQHLNNWGSPSGAVIHNER